MYICCTIWESASVHPREELAKNRSAHALQYSRPRKVSYRSSGMDPGGYRIIIQYDIYIHITCIYTHICSYFALPPRKTCKALPKRAHRPIQVSAKYLGKLDAILRRLCQPRSRGRRAPPVSVSEDVKKQWAKGGSARRELLSILVEYDGDKDP